MSFHFVFSVLRVFSSSCLFFFMLTPSLSWTMLILWQLGRRKVSLVKWLHLHGHFVSFDDVKVGRTILIPVGEG